MKTSNKENAVAIKALATTINAEEVSVKQIEAIEKLANTGKGPRMSQPMFNPHENVDDYINFKSFLEIFLNHCEGNNL